MVQTLLAGICLMLVVVGIWFAVHYWLNPRLDAPDAKACITGSCGDTMEICLQFENNKVVKTSHWTSGCAYSFNCILSAAGMAKGKTPEQILDIDADMIQKSVGGLPEDHIHCATLAVQTLHSAIDDYMRKTLIADHRYLKGGDTVT